MRVLSTNKTGYYNSGHRISQVHNPIAFEGIVRPSKLITTKGPLRKRLQVFWIDTRRNYCVFDFENSGKIKNNALLKNPILREVFDFFELKLKNFHKVSEKYCRGGVITCEYDILRLKRKGVTDIVNLLETEKLNQNLIDFAKKQGIKYHHIELLPPYGIPKQDQINRFFNIIDKSEGSAYVHCLHGKDRTGIMTFLYEMDLLKVKPQKAIKHMIDSGLHAKKNVHMIEFLAKRYPEISEELGPLIR